MKSSCLATSTVTRALLLLASLHAGTVSTLASSGRIASLDERIEGSQRVVVSVLASIGLLDAIRKSHKISAVSLRSGDANVWGEFR